MQYVKIADIKVSRFILGSNPFSGFSHKTPEIDMEMKRFHTSAKIKETLREAESLGVNALIARKIQWFAQTCPELGTRQTCVERAATGGAKACHIHGGVMDFLFAQKRLDEIPPAIDMIRRSGMPAGIAGHNPEVFRWAEENLDVDYYLCSYYNAAHRDEKAEHISGMKEWFLEKDRRIMTDLIQNLSRPVIHYKIMAAGRNNPEEAFAHTAKKMRPGDAVCVGVFSKHIPDMLQQDVELLENNL